MTKEELNEFYEVGFTEMKGGKIVITAEEDGISVDSSMTYMGALLGAGMVIGTIMEDVGPADMALIAQLLYSGIIGGHSSDEIGKAYTMLLADFLHKAVHSDPEEESKP